ncbi:MAG: hypothetical protein ACE5IG_02505, partial [Dehalococcoidia bacterium]
GTSLDAYTTYPQLATAAPPAPTLSQEDYRWYANADAVQPTTALATENTAITNTTPGTVYRLRMNVEDAGAELPAGEVFKLQYSTSTLGPWTDVGALASAEIWRGFDNLTPADGATVSATLLTTSTVVETYEETNNSATTPNAILVSGRGEWDWVVENNGAAESTTYFFRMVKGDATALDAYTTYPQLSTAASTLTQDSYRWFANADDVQPGAALAAENIAITSVTAGQVLRLRLSLQESTYLTPAGQVFKLQYATSTAGPWTDVGALASAEIWRGFDNPTPLDGASITATLLSGATILETYEEANNSAATPNAIILGNAAEWDWVLENNNANASTTYYFRVVFSDGSAVDSYTAYPQLSTASGGEVLTQNQYRWYDNADAVQPGAALAAEDTPFTSASSGTVYHLRMNINNTGVNLPAGEVFKLQYSTSTAGPWTDVGAPGSGATWRGFDNPTPADGAALTSALLSSSFNNDRETYEEANDSVPTPNDIRANKPNEWGWVLQANPAQVATSYFFRMVRSGGAPLDGYTTYPEISIPNTPPDAPSALGPAQFIDNATGWTNDNTPTLSFTLSDPDTGQQVRYQVQIATDSGFTALVVDFTSNLQAQGATSFTVGQTGGTYATGSAGMTLADTAAGYFWRVETIDELAAASGYSDAGAPATADFRVDATPPSGGVVDDGLGADIDLNDGSLTTMSANWGGFSDATSGIAGYEYSVGMTPGATDVRGWTSTGLSTLVTDASLNLHTGQTYFFNVRAVDAAGNVTASPTSSNGQAVLPTLTVAVSATEVVMGNFNPDNSFTQVRTVTVTVSTNAYQGYVIRAYTPDFLRSLNNPAVIIPDFSAGSYASPAEWSGSGFGYNTDDCDVNSGQFWTGAGCTGNPKYAPFTHTGAGDIVADHTALVTGATGPVVNELFTITLRATTASVQLASEYAVDLIFDVVPSS